MVKELSIIYFVKIQTVLQTMEQKKCNERHSIRRITIKRELGSPCAKKPKNDNDQDEPESSVDVRYKMDFFPSNFCFVVG